MIATRRDALEVIEFLVGELLSGPGRDLSPREELIEVFIGALSIGSQQPEWAELLLKLINADAYRLDGMSRQEIARAIVELEPVAVDGREVTARRSERSPVRMLAS